VGYRAARMAGLAVLAACAWGAWRLWERGQWQPLPAAAPQAPGEELALASRAAVLMDYQSGRVLYAKNAEEPLAPASVTKVMTLMLALEAIQQGKASLADEVVASERAASMGGSQVWLEVGERMPLRELLYAIAVGSANDASVAVAEHLAGSEGAFVEWMNRRARELGMRHTRFANSTGLPPEETGGAGPHVASAYDLAVLSRQAIRTPGLLEMVSAWEFTMRPQGLRKPVLYNFNRLLKRYPGVDGLKTGMTQQAGYCIAVTAVRDHLRLIAVTMGAPTAQAREQDVRTLLDWGFRRFEARPLASAGQEVGWAEVARGQPRWVPLVLAEDAYLTVERGTRLEVDLAPQLPRRLQAPVRESDRVGVVRLVRRSDGQVVAEVEVRPRFASHLAPAVTLIGREWANFLKALAPVAAGER